MSDVVMSKRTFSVRTFQVRQEPGVPRNVEHSKRKSKRI